MEGLIILVLLVVLVINIFNIGMIIRVARIMGSMDAFSSEKAIELRDTYSKIYLYGPLLSWSNLKKTEDNRYWIELKGWSVVRVGMFAVLSFLLFTNVYLLLFFITAY